MHPHPPLVRVSFATTPAQPPLPPPRTTAHVSAAIEMAIDLRERLRDRHVTRATPTMARASMINDLLFDTQPNTLITFTTSVCARELERERERARPAPSMRSRTRAVYPYAAALRRSE